MRNYTGYCNPEVDKLIDQQSAEPDPEKRKQLAMVNSIHEGYRMEDVWLDK